MFNEIIKRGDIYYANLGKGEGSEQEGIRPVLVIQNDIGNKFSPTIIIAAITSKDKTKVPTHVEIDAQKYGLPKNSVVLLEQIRTIDKKRLREKIGTLDNEIMDCIDRSCKISVGLMDSKFNESYIHVRINKIMKLNFFIDKYKNTDFDVTREEYERIALMGEIITYCNRFKKNPKLYLRGCTTDEIAV